MTDTVIISVITKIIGGHNMKKLIKVISLLFAAALAISMSAFTASAAEEIRTAEELMNMNSDGDYYLGCDIDLTNYKWKPVYSFSGTFDGNGYEIIGMRSETYGLFSSLRSRANVKNVILTDVYITSKYKTVGAVASIINSSEKDITIENCYVSGLVSSCRTKFGQNSSSTAGSIVGCNNSSSAVISNCYSNAVVASERIVGGIAGTNRGTITSCGFGGQLGSAYNIYELGCDKFGNKAEVYKYLYAVGGIAGYNYGKISNSFSTCTRVDVANFYGGICGVLQKGAHITYCVNSSDVLYDDILVGGLITGYASSKSTILNCYTKKPTNNTVSNDVGKGKKDTVTYSVSSQNYGKITSFKRLDSDWKIFDGYPILKRLSDYVSRSPIYEIKNERLISVSESQSVSEEDDDDASVDYGFDEFGDILE